MKCIVEPLRNRGKQTIFGFRTEMLQYAPDKAMFLELLDSFISRWKRKEPISQKVTYFVDEYMYDFLFEVIRDANRIVNSPVFIRKLDFHVFDIEDGDDINMIHLFIEKGGDKAEEMNFVIENDKTEHTTYSINASIHEKLELENRLKLDEVFILYNLNSEERKYFSYLSNFIRRYMNRREINAFGALVEKYRTDHDIIGHDKGLKVVETSLILGVSLKTIDMLVNQGVLIKKAYQINADEVRVLKKLGMEKGVNFLKNPDKFDIQ